MEETESAETLDGTGLPRGPSAIGPLARIGRYPILRKLGAGGMGVVYAGYDDVLDRKVAIKLLRPGSGEGRPGTRLLREAQGLARLSHPNVVQIYEIGQHGDAVFMAMEFVAGQTLGDWLEQQARSRAAILDAFTAAGRGLAAAHAARLIHRDFKPDNVMIAEGGRVKVMDFGLVRADSDGHELGRSGTQVLDEAERSLTVSQSDSLGVDLTKTGSIMGTPAYMAPEQHFGRPTDARCDQFSFCVALWEALCGTRPFAGETMAALAFNVTQGTIVEPPREAALPSWMRKVIERGLALDPDQRWPSMDALLATLADDPTRRRWTLVGVVVVAVASVGAWSWQQAEQDRAATAERESRDAAMLGCEDEGRAIEASWNPTTRERVEQAFASSELRFAVDTWARTRPMLDEYAQTWSDIRTQVCIEVEVDGSLDPTRVARTLECLAEREAALGSLATLLAEPAEARVLRAVSSAAELPPLADCTDPAKLAQMPPVPDDPELRERVGGLRERLAQVHALDTMGEFELASTQAAAALVEAESIDWPPLMAAANYAVGKLAAARGDFPAARTAYEDAMMVAAKAGNDLLVLDAAIGLVYTVGIGLDEADEGLRVGKLAEALLDRLGAQGSLADGALRSNLGAIHERAGRLELALASFERSLAIYEARLPNAHPSISIALNNIGTVHAREGRLDQALAYFERTLAIRMASLPPGHPRFAAAYENIGSAYAAKGDYARAAVSLERALAINEASLPANHLDIAGNATSLAYAHYQRDDFTAALPLFRRALAIRVEVLAPESRLIGSAHSNVALALEGLAQFDEALEHFALALAIHEAALPPDDPRLGGLLSDYGRTLARAGRVSDALALLERALAIHVADEAEPEVLGDSKLELAKVLWETSPKRRAEARTLMREASELYRTAEKTELATQAEQWLRGHGD